MGPWMGGFRLTAEVLSWRVEDDDRLQRLEGTPARWDDSTGRRQLSGHPKTV